MTHSRGTTKNGTLCGAKGKVHKDVTCKRCLKKMNTTAIKAVVTPVKKGLSPEEKKVAKNFASRVKYNLYMDEQIGIHQQWVVGMRGLTVEADGMGGYTVSPADKNESTSQHGKAKDLMTRLGALLFSDSTFFTRQDKKRKEKKATRNYAWGSVYSKE